MDRNLHTAYLNYPLQVSPNPFPLSLTQCQPQPPRPTANPLPPKRLQRMNLATAFCTETGQVKTGENKSDTYSKMLQEVVRVTPSIAQAIIDRYPTVLALVRAFRENGPLILQDLQKATNRNGGFSERSVGKAISRRLYDIFTERDPTSTRV